MDKLLTIAIPTYNRPAKLKRLLTILHNEIVDLSMQEQIDVLVSDNASKNEIIFNTTDFADNNFRITYYRQNTNLGFDGNLRFLYIHTKSKFVWFLADDDLPLKGSIGKILNTLKVHDPDVMLFSFIQPPGSIIRQFDYSDPVWSVTTPTSAIEHVLRYPKVSIFVIRKVNLDNSQWQALDKSLGSGWYFVPLAFSVMETSRDLRLAVVSEPLATCDDDYVRLPWVPSAFLGMYKMTQHSFVLKYNPSLVQFYRNEGYYQAIQFSFAVKSGSLVAENDDEYNHFISDLEWRIPVLIRRPRFLLQFLALKLRIACLWPKIKSIFWARKIF